MKAYKIVKDQNGNRFVKMEGGGIIPADVAGMAVGKDAWMRDIQCKCRECGNLFSLSLLQGGGQWCEGCQLAAVE